MHIALRTLFLTFFFCGVVAKSNAYCSLERMKKFAMEACEHLFMQDEGREKRSLPMPYEHNYLHHNEYPKHNDKSHFISRSSFPRGGYLKVGQEHFQILSKVDVFPRYKPKKHHDKKERYKREHALSYNNIPYCCYNKCEEDFFC
ncbi:uncharacterized protein LOC101461861 [Ceratitis capitata]|uniref:(Mediterranean fruit fly) hypothetical protein n=1 Tax=Ceratitis capitata TaxID=7213 RepID=W8BXM9_CERCA|nr:uncharacterized protein LOC101461861 [Ceratitis capitata]CAD7006671.1 unnamed protein product [Ceratitis capitata]